jgi:hypothetical protein
MSMKPFGNKLRKFRGERGTIVVVPSLNVKREVIMALVHTGSYSDSWPYPQPLDIVYRIYPFRVFYS